MNLRQKLAIFAALASVCLLFSAIIFLYEPEIKKAVTQDDAPCTLQIGKVQTVSGYDTDETYQTITGQVVNITPVDNEKIIELTLDFNGSLSLRNAKCVQDTADVIDGK